MRMRAAALLSLLLVLPGPALHAQSAATLLQRAADNFRQLRSLSADFDQVVKNEMVGTFASRGALVQSGASRLAMRFADPKGEAIVIDGTYIWIYTPSTAPGQVLRVPIASASGYGVNLLGWLLDRPAERYHAGYVRKDTVDGVAVDVINLEPAVVGLPFTGATLWLARSDGLPRRIEVTEPSGNHRTVTLSHLKPNPELPPDAFVFTPPKGVKIVDR